MNWSCNARSSVIWKTIMNSQIKFSLYCESQGCVLLHVVLHSKKFGCFQFTLQSVYKSYTLTILILTCFLPNKLELRKAIKHPHGPVKLKWENHFLWILVINLMELWPRKSCDEADWVFSTQVVTTNEQDNKIRLFNRSLHDKTVSF